MGLHAQREPSAHQKQTANPRVTVLPAPKSLNPSAAPTVSPTRMSANYVGRPASVDHHLAVCLQSLLLTPVSARTPVTADNAPSTESAKELAVPVHHHARLPLTILSVGRMGLRMPTSASSEGPLADNNVHCLWPQEDLATSATLSNADWAPGVRAECASAQWTAQKLWSRCATPKDNRTLMNVISEGLPASREGTWGPRGLVLDWSRIRRPAAEMAARDPVASVPSALQMESAAARYIVIR